MSNELDSTAKEIRQLHNELFDLAKTSLAKVIRIGGLLHDVKARLKHGEWLPWLKKNVPFSQPTAFRYMSCYDRRDELKSAKVTDIGDAYALLHAPAVLTKKSGEVEAAIRFAREQGLEGELEFMSGGTEECGMIYGPCLRHEREIPGEFPAVTIVEIGDDTRGPHISLLPVTAAQKAALREKRDKDFARGRARRMHNLPRRIEAGLSSWLEAIREYDSKRDKAKSLGKWLIQFGNQLIKQGERLTKGK